MADAMWTDGVDAPAAGQDLDAWLRDQAYLTLTTTSPVDVSAVGPLPALETLSVRGPVTGLGGLLASPRLSSVSLDSCPPAVLADAPEQQVVLTIRGSGPSDVLDVAHWNLRALHVVRSRASEITCPPDLARLHLEHAAIGGWLAAAVRGVRDLVALDCGVRDLGLLRDAQDLQNLALGGDGHGSTLDLAGCDRLRLRSLSAIGYGSVNWPSARMDELAHLSIGAYEGSPPRLDRFPALVGVSVTAYREVDVADLRLPEQVAAFRATDGGLVIRNLDHLGRATNLEHVDLDFSSVDNVRFATGLRRLRQLGLRQTLVDDLEPLRGHPSLERLDIADSPVLDVSPLADCPSLVELEIESFDEAPDGLSLLDPRVRVRD